MIPESETLVVQGRLFFANRAMCLRGLESYRHAGGPVPAEQDGSWLRYDFSGSVPRATASQVTRAICGAARRAAGGFVDVMVAASLGVRVRAGGSWKVCAPSLPGGANRRLGTLAFRNLQGVSAVAFSPGGTQLATANAAGEIWLWQVTSGELLHQLVGHDAVTTMRGTSSLVQAISFAPDGGMLVSGGLDGIIRIWDPATGKQLKKRSAHTGPEGVLDVAVSPDGTSLASVGSGGVAKIWGARSGRVLAELDCQGIAHRCVFSLLGERLVTLVGRGRCLIWDLTKSEVEHSIEAEYGFENLAISSDGRTLALGHAQHPPSLWDVESGRKLGTMKSPNDRILEHFGCLCFNPAGTHLAVFHWGAYDERSGFLPNSLRLWDVQSGACGPLFEGALKDPRSMSFSPDGKFLVTSGDTGLRGTAPRIWDVAHAKESQLLPGHAAAVCSLSFEPNGRWLASCGEDHSVRVWDLQNGQQVMSLPWDTVLSPFGAFSPDGGSLLVAGGALRIWQPAQAGWSVHPAYREAARRLEFAHGGRLIALSQQGNLSVWAPEGERELLGIPGVVDFCLSFEGGRVLMALEEGGLKLLDLEPVSTTTVSVKGSGFRALALSETRQLCAFIDAEGGLHGFDLIDGVELYARPDAHARSLALTPGGSQLAVGRDDGSIWMLNSMNGEKSCDLRGHCGAVRVLRISPDGSQLASGSEDTTILLWPLKSGHPSP